MQTDRGADAVSPMLTISAVLELRRDDDGHLVGWVSDVDGGHRDSFIGTLDLLRTLIDRLDEATEATAGGSGHDPMSPNFWPSA